MTKSVLVTGANGFLGAAVADAFARAGWKTFGLIRRSSSAHILYSSEVTPIIGSSQDVESILTELHKYTHTLDVIVGTTEDINNYQEHHANNVIFFRELAKESGKHGIRPLLIFTSGCKDYGRSGLDGSSELVEHTEESPLNPPPFAIHRAEASVKMLNDHSDLLDIVSTRATTLWGRSSSFYGVFFDLMDQAKREKDGKAIDIYADGRTALHGIHVDDAGRAYVAIAEAPRDKVKGKVYNISAHRYETLDEIMSTLVQEYNIKGKIDWKPDAKGAKTWSLEPVLGFSQWVSSDRLRQDTGWKDVRMLFSQDVGVYRRAYEFAKAQEYENIAKIQTKLGHDFGKNKD